LCACVTKNQAEPVNKKITIGIIIKHLSTGYPPGNNMMERSGRIYAGFAWHYGLV
jgi:hypothetical protein